MNTNPPLLPISLALPEVTLPTPEAWGLPFPHQGNFVLRQKLIFQSPGFLSPITYLSSRLLLYPWPVHLTHPQPLTRDPQQSKLSSKTHFHHSIQEATQGGNIFLSLALCSNLSPSLPGLLRALSQAMFCAAGYVYHHHQLS